jgi:hypothetical protein
VRVVRSAGGTVGAPGKAVKVRLGVTSDNVNRSDVSFVTFRVTGVARAGYTYTPAANEVTSVPDAQEGRSTRSR